MKNNPTISSVCPHLDTIISDGGFDKENKLLFGRHRICRDCKAMLPLKITPPDEPVHQLKKCNYCERECHCKAIPPSTHDCECPYPLRRNKQIRPYEALPCPHGRPAMNGVDGWHSCPHCLGVNQIAPPPDGVKKCKCFRLDCGECNERELFESNQAETTKNCPTCGPNGCAGHTVRIVSPDETKSVCKHNWDYREIDSGMERFCKKCARKSKGITCLQKTKRSDEALADKELFKVWEDLKDTPTASILGYVPLKFTEIDRLLAAAKREERRFLANRVLDELTYGYSNLGAPNGFFEYLTYLKENLSILKYLTPPTDGK